jgi:hypothetical protein
MTAHLAIFRTFFPLQEGAVNGKPRGRKKGGEKRSEPGILPTVPRSTPILFRLSLHCERCWILILSQSLTGPEWYG